MVNSLNTGKRIRQAGFGTAFTSRALELLIVTALLTVGLRGYAGEPSFTRPATNEWVIVIPTEASVGVGAKIRLFAFEKEFKNHKYDLIGAYEKIGWKSSHPGIATVDEQGFVTGKRAGRANIIATTPLGRSVVQVHVGEQVNSVRAPEELSMVEKCSYPLSVTLFGEQGGDILTSREISWTSSDRRVVAIPPIPYLFSASTLPLPTRVYLVGLSKNELETLNKLLLTHTMPLQGVAPGTALITATSEGKTGRSIVTVKRASTSLLRLSPSSIMFDAGIPTPIQVDYVNQANCNMPNKLLEWKVGDPAIAEWSPRFNTITGRSGGSTNLVATAPDGVQASTLITVPKVESVEIKGAPYKTSLFAHHHLELSAITKGVNGITLKHRGVLWKSSSESVVLSITDSGYAVTIVARTEGVAVISATSEGVSGSIEVTVPTVASTVSIRPSGGNIQGQYPVRPFSIVAEISSATGERLNRNCTWSLSSGSPVILDQVTSCVINLTPIEPGVAFLSVTTEDGLEASALYNVCFWNHYDSYNECGF